MSRSSSLYRRHRFPGEIISHCVWLYYRFSLSYRDIEEMMAQRGVRVSYETIRQWYLKFGQTIAAVVLLPLFLGTLKKALLPRGEYAYNGASEVWAPISSTNTNRLWSSARTVERHTNLSHSSRSLAPVDLFFGCAPGA